VYKLMSALFIFLQQYLVFKDEEKLYLF